MNSVLRNQKRQLEKMKCDERRVLFSIFNLEVLAHCFAARSKRPTFALQFCMNRLFELGLSTVSRDLQRLAEAIPCAVDITIAYANENHQA